MIQKEIRRGDIYYARLGKSEGSVQSKIRPVVIIQNDKGNKYSSTVIVATITSKSQKKKSQPTHVIFNADGLRTRSVVQLEQIMTIDKCQLLNYVSTMGGSPMKRVNRAIKESLDVK